MTLTYRSPVNRVINLFVLALSLTAWDAYALDAHDFRSCLQTSNTTCQLDSGTYYITTSTSLAPTNDNGPDYQPFVITGNNLTVEGTLNGTELATTLIRNDTSCTPACTYNLMSINGTSVTNLTVQDFIFDGNRSLWGSTLNCAASPPPGTVCPTYYIDLNLSNALPSSSYAILVTGSTFQNSPNYALETANDTAVTYSKFYSTFQSAIITYYMSGIGAYEDYFEASGGGAIALIATTTNSIQWNQFYWNHRECGDDNPGGQISIDYYSNYTTFNDNYLDGGWTSGHMLSGCYSQGVEVYGANQSILSNVITDHNSFGIAANGVSSLTLGAESGFSANQITSNGDSGIQIGDDEGGYYNCSTSITFGGDTIGGNTNYGIYDYEGSCSLALYNESGVTFSPNNSVSALNFVCNSGSVSCT